MKYIFLLIAVAIAPASYAVPPTSVGALEFLDGNTLFVADPDAGQIIAYTLPITKTVKESRGYNHIKFGSDAAKILKVPSQDLTFHDMATHPVSGEVWTSVTMNKQGENYPVILRVDAAGNINVVDLTKLQQTSKQLINTPNDGVKFWRDIPATTLAITDLDYMDGVLYVSGLSTGEFSSTLREIPYPFNDKNDTSHIEIYHTVHDQTETRAPIRAMTVLNLNGEKTIVAAYTCTPLVTIPTKALKDGANVRGKTVAELGYGNTPLDVIQFTAPNKQQKPEDYVLVVHKDRDADLIRVADLAKGTKKESLSTPEMWGQAGVPTRSIPLSGVMQVADQDQQYIATLKRNIDSGDIDLVSFRKGAYFRLPDFISEYNFPDYKYKKEQDFFRKFQNVLKVDAGYSDLTRELSE